MSSHSAISGRGRARGGWAPRRGRGGPAHPFKKRNEVKLDLDRHPLGELLTTFKTSDLEAATGGVKGDATIKDCKNVSSYNWLDAKTPTIMVPGKPPLWTPLTQPQRLKEDSGQYFRDPNAAMFPSYPTEPAVQALLNTTPDFPTEDIDIFACGSTMGNLLRFVRSIDKPFRFGVQLIGNTVFFVRKENDPKEIIEGIHGYGHTFPEAYTTWESQVKGSETHQRLVQYDFGGFRCLLRFECDGYLQGPGSPSTSDSTPDKRYDFESLLKAFGDSALKPAATDPNGDLTVQSGGSPVPQSAIFDLKTRSNRYKKDIDMSDIHPQLWVKQIPNFIVAYHDGEGLFQDIRVQDVRKDIEVWEKDNKLAIQHLAVLLRKIIDIAKEDATGLLEVYCPSVDRLEIRRQYGEGSQALPPSLRAVWAGVNDNEADDLFESDHGEEDFNSRNVYDSLWDDKSEDGSLDFTACSADSCGYCGKCSY